MRISGSAYNNGVEFSSDNYQVKYTMNRQGRYKITYRKLIEVEGIRAFLMRVPLLKGMYALFSDKPVFILTAIVLIANDVLGSKLSSNTSLATRYILLTSVFLVGFACVFFVFKKILYKAKNTWSYHGAEHKTVYAHEHGIELTPEKVRECPRIASRCGTNLVVFVVFFFVILCFITDYMSIRYIGAFVLGYELFDLENGDKYPVITVFFRFGQWCQQKLFTREPTDKQIIASIETLKKLIDLESQDPLQ